MIGRFFKKEALECVPVAFLHRGVETVAAKPRIHLTAVASHATQAMQLLGVKNADDLNTVSETQRGKFGNAAKSVEPVDVQKEMSETSFRPASGTRELPAQ